MPTLEVCPKCRKVCAKCHGDVHNGGSLKVCKDWKINGLENAVSAVDPEKDLELQVPLVLEVFVIVALNQLQNASSAEQKLNNK